MSATIQAAGAVVWRNNKDKTEVAIIHRPKYDDWSFPKGKVEINESLIACAHREVLEETNIQTEFGAFLGDVEYLTQDGKKQVSFWAAKAITYKDFSPNSEVDQLKWVEVKKVKELLTLETDKKILAQFIKLDFDTKPFILLRHAKAITRDEWQGDDDDRPLDSLGQNQAKRLLSIYQVYNLEQIHTSDAVRCYDTVNPMVDYAKDLIKEDARILLCSHNPILPKMLNKLTKKSDVDADEDKLSPADGWVIHRSGKEIIQIDRIDAPTF